MLKMGAARGRQSERRVVRNDPYLSVIDNLAAEGARVDAMQNRPRDSFKSLAESLVSFTKKSHDVLAQEQLGIAWSIVPEIARDPLISAFDRGIEKCESPIEKHLLPWILAECARWSNWEPLLLFPGESDQLPSGRLAIIPQLPIGAYRCDFAIAGRRRGPVRFSIIECDGAEFHDKGADATRDERILKNPRILKIFRFTGAEIFKDVKSVASRISLDNLRYWKGLE